MASGEYAQLPGNTGYNFQPTSQVSDPYGATEFLSSFLQQSLPQAFGKASQGADPSYLQKATQAPDQNAFMSQFGQDFNQLSDQTVGATSELGSRLQNQVDRFTNQAVGDIGDKFAGANALYSSGFGKTAGEAAGNIAGNAGVQLGQAQLGLLNPLAQGVMTRQGQGLDAARNANLQAGIQGMGGDQSMLNSMMGTFGSFARPQYTQSQYYQPEYVYEPSPWENVKTNMSDMANLWSTVR